LGSARICEVHLKDNPHYLGEGKIDFKAVIDALADVGFDGWALPKAGERDTPCGPGEATGEGVRQDLAFHRRDARQAPPWSHRRRVPGLAPWPASHEEMNVIRLAWEGPAG